jgi:aryl-alcohol dehydrogenase-like predicted oxidoreductase
MLTRKLGKTGHLSSILTLGAFALGQVEQKEADSAIELALQAGINQVDVAPSYGDAEKRLGSWIGRHGNPFFLNCKTMERTKEAAWEGLQRSLACLKVDHFDLFQFHAVDNLENLNVILSPGGALEAVLEAKKQGLLKHIGITGHHPPLYLEALKRFDFDTVLFPLNRVHAAHFAVWNDWRPLLKEARRRGVGVLAIKSVAKGLWAGGRGDTHHYSTWYEPFDEPREIENSLRYTLSQDITTAVLPGDCRLWPTMLDVANRFQPLTAKEQSEVMAEVAQYPPLRAAWMQI